MTAAPHSLDAIARTCLHCGLCLPVCPTYELTLDERSSPRGRIRLMKSVMEGTLEPGEGFVDEMNFCLDCRACETACPAGVEYGALVEDARAHVRGLEPASIRIRKFLVLRGLLGSRRRFRFFAAALRLYRRTGFAEALERSGLAGLFPRSVRRLLESIPPAGEPFAAGGDGVIPARGPARGRVALLTGCIMNVSFPEVNRDTADLLRMAGYEVEVPRGQFCCGSLHGHNGEPERARELASALMGAFPSGSGAVVVNAAGCGAFMKDYGRLFADDAARAPIAGAFSRRVKDVSEFLVSAGIPPAARAVQSRVTYHDACHLLHAQGISREPRAILAAIPGMELIEMRDPGRCCGSAGIYNLLRPRDSDELLRRKVEGIAATGARTVVTGNPGCHLQIERGLRAAGLDVEVVHPATMLRRAIPGREP